jgi:PTS system ascorbate-specific IIA component
MNWNQSYPLIWKVIHKSKFMLLKDGEHAMISDMLQKKNVQILESVSDWQEAIDISTQALIEQGYITANYPKAIIELTEKYGAYYVLCPDVALIHARPEDGVIHKQLAVTLVKKPVKFKGKEDQVRLLITLAAEDSESHLRVLQHIAEILSDQQRIASFMKIEDTDHLYQKFISLQ